MRGMRTLGIWGFVCLLSFAPAAFAPRVAHAGPADDEKAKKQAEARDHYQAGITHYNLGEFDAAIAEFKQAYALSGAPGLLFNIAQAYRLQGDYKQAAYFYKTYLRLDPNAANKADVEARIAEMEKAMADQKAIEDAKPKGTIPIDGSKPPTDGTGTGNVKPPDDSKPKDVVKDGATTVTVDEKPVADGAKVEKPKDEPVVEPGHPGKSKKLIGYAAGGTGAALLVTGVIFGMKASSATTKINDASKKGLPWTDDLQSTYDSGKSAESTATILYIAGGAALVGGGVFWYLGWKADKDAAGGDVAIAPTSGGAMMTWSGEF